MRRSLATLVILCAGRVAGAQTAPTPQLGGVPPPPTVAMAATPPAPAPTPPQQLAVTLVPQAAPPAYAAPQAFAAPVPVLGVASGQFAAPPMQQQQQGVGTIALLGATFLVDNPWIVDRFLARIGAWLHSRGQPVLRMQPPTLGLVTTSAPIPTTAPMPVTAPVAGPQPIMVPVPASALPAPPGAPQLTPAYTYAVAPQQQQAVIAVQAKPPHRTALGRWFWGE